MSANAISQFDLQNLLIKINKTSSFIEKLHFTLNWAGNDYQKIAFTGVSWFNETSFFIKADQLAVLFGVKTETIGASLRHNNFIKQYNPLPNGQRYFWSKPGFSVNGFQSKNQIQNSSSVSNIDSPNSNQAISAVEFNSLRPDKQSLNTSSTISSSSTSFSSTACSVDESTFSYEKDDEIQEKTLYKTGNREFDEILNKIYSSSDQLNSNEIIEIFYKKFCPSYIEKSSVEEVFNDYFSVENCHLQTKETDCELLISREEFWIFYQHFGPLNSILTKYNLYKSYSSQDSSRQILIGDKNKFLVNGIIHIYNDMKQHAGKSFLKDENGHSYDSWEKIIESQNDQHEASDQPPIPILPQFIVYPIL